MIDVTDRVSENVNSFTMIKSDGSSEKVILISNETPVIEGTPINRKVLMAMQGFQSVTTTFGEDKITETNDEGHIMETIFNSDGSITERFTANDRTIAKTTYFDEDGTIREVMTS